MFHKCSGWSCHLTVGRFVGVNSEPFHMELAYSLLVAQPPATSDATMSVSKCVRMSGRLHRYAHAHSWNLLHLHHNPAQISSIAMVFRSVMSTVPEEL